MKPVALFSLLVLVLVSGSCSKYFHTERPSSKSFPDSISLDAADYVLFTRTLCRLAPNSSHYFGPRFYHRATAPAERMNCDGNVGNDTLNEVLEREYMLVSFSKRKVIYISPYPPYVEYNWWYLYDRAVFDDPTFVNLWYANRFEFGMLSADSSFISFQHKNQSRIDTFCLSWGATGAMLSIDSVIMYTKKKPDRYGVDRSLSQGLKFVRQPSFTLGFQMKLDKPFTPGDTASFRLAKDLIYLDDNSLYFPLPVNAINQDGRVIGWIIFDGKRVSSSARTIED